MASYLILQAARFGDLVQSRRLVRSVERQGEVHLGVEQGLVPLARLLYPNAHIHGLCLHGQPAYAALEQNRRVLAEWRATDFSAVYNCNFSGVTATLCRVFDTYQVQGYRFAPAGIWRSPWARLAFYLSEKRHLTSLNLTDFWAYFVSNPVAPNVVNPKAVPGDQGLGVALAGRESRRSLPVPLLAEIVRVAHDVLGTKRIRLLGSTTEQALAHRLLRHLPPKLLPCVEDLSGKTDWQGLTQAVEGLDALITPDTGIMHLAAHMGVPVLAFFLSSAWCHETGPYGEGHYVWQASRSCAPCLESRACPDDTACILPLQDKNFLHCLGAVLQRKVENTVRLPDGLQLWQSSFDGLGGTMELLAGKDENAVARAIMRDQLKKMLNFSQENHVKTTTSQHVINTTEMKKIRFRLCKDTDWMLPPLRYC